MNDIHAAILTVAQELFPANNFSSHETLLADLTDRESEFQRLHDMLTIWRNATSPETDVATVHPSDNHESAELMPGIYREPGRATLYKVQPSKAGRLYAKELVNGSFKYSRGAIFKVKPEWRLTSDEMQAYGIETQHCIVCQRKLDVLESIKRGMGPVCFAKYC